MASLLFPDDEQSRVQPLLIPAPPDERGPLAPDPRADAFAQATGQVYQRVSDYIAKQQQDAIDRGLWEGGQVWEGGHPTRGGLLDALHTTAEGVAMGTTSSGGGKPGFPTMYHGSPHEFQPTPKNPLGEFRDTAIGSGEGNQAFGYGHYLAEREGVSQSYKKGGDPRDVLNDYLAGIKNFTQQIDDPRISASEIKTGLARHDDAAMRALSTNEKAVGDIVEMLRGYDPASATHTDAALAAYGRLDKALPPPSKGHMYEVRVHADPERFLHWDKPLSEQHPDVRAALEKTGQMDYARKYFEANARRFPNGPTGEDLHEFLKMAHGNNIRPTEILSEAGIPGIRYLDQGSRGAGEGSHNAVVFSPETMEIIRRYGLAGLMLGGGGLLSPSKQEER